MHSLEYVKTYRQMPWIKRGMRVVANGREGHVASGAPGGHITIKFPGVRRGLIHHPQWMTTYYDAQGNVLADYCQ